MAYRFGPETATTSDAIFSRYAGSGPAGQPNGGGTFTASLFNPGAGNPRLALTYTSYADITINGRTTSTEREFAVFGNATPAGQLPRTGTGSYSGIVSGAGDRTGTPMEIDGTAALDVNFGNQTFIAALTIGGRTPGASSSIPLGQIDYRGFASNGSLFGDVSNPANQGSLRGQLYGPNAAEFGFVFDFNGNTPDGRLAIKGAAVGKRR
jgi:hypothetical protein